MTRRPILIAHAEGDEEHAELLAAPLVAAGYEVVHKGTVLVGESLIAEASRVLAAGGPVVLCGTARAAGSRWAHKLVHAARRYTGVRVFGLEMDQEAYLEPLTLDGETAAHWLDPDRAMRSLLAALARHYPLDPSAEPTDESVTRAETAYRNLLLNNCDIINLTSLPGDRRLATRQLMLRSLFVPLKVRVEREAGDLPDAAVLDAIERRRAATRGALPQGGETGRDRSEPAAAGSRHPRDVPVGLGARLQASRRLVVLGDPGAGKSTMLRWMATAFLLRLRGDPDWSELPAVDTLPDEDWLPILLRCRELGSEQLNGSLADMLAHALGRLEVPDAAVLRAALLRRLAEGTALLLVDGLDEIADAPARARFCEQLERVHVAYPGAPIIVTSRIVGYREMGYRIGRGFEHVTLAELGRQEKDDFIRRWCAVTEPPNQQKEVAAEISEDIHSTDRIERLTGNPMLLTTMALVKRTVGKLPEHRADLYRAAIGVLLNWRSQVDGPVEYREAVPQLGYMAYDMSFRGAQQITDDELIALLDRMRDEYPRLHTVARRTPAEFIRLMESRTGLLTESGRVHDVPVYEFRHLTFQEYLTALALVERRFPGRDPKRTLAGDVALLADRLDDQASVDSSVDQSWKEAVRLVVTLCPDDDVEPVLQAILGPDDREGEAAAARAVLAARCLQDEPNAGPAIVRRVLRRLVRALPSEGRELDAYDAVRSLAGSRSSGELISCLLAELRIRSANASTDLAALLGEVISRSAPSTPAELGAWQAARIDDLIADERETVLRAVLVIGHGAFGDNRAAERLVRMLDNPDELLAHAAAWALGRLTESSSTCAWRLTEQQADVIQQAADPATVRPSRLVLLARVLDPRRWPEAIGPLVNAAQDSNPFVRSAAVRLLGLTKRSAVLPAIVGRLGDESAAVRMAAARALGEMHSDDAVPPLLTCLHDEDPDVRRAAATALGSSGDVRAVPPLIAALRTSEGEVAGYIAEALGTLGDSRAGAPVLEGVRKADENQTYRFIYALNALSYAKATPYLLDRLLHDPDGLEFWLCRALGTVIGDQAYDRVSAVSSPKVLSTLAWLGGDLAFERVRAVLGNGEAEDREEGLFGLNQLNEDQATQLIAGATTDDVPSNRRLAAECLTKRMDSRIGSRLVSLLEDPDIPSRLAAVAALGGYPDHTVFESLAPLLRAEDPRQRSAAAVAFYDHFDPRPVEPLLEALSDPVAEVREEAARSLGSQMSRKPIRRLAKLLHDRNPNVRSTAAGSLGKLGARSAVGDLVRMLSADDAGERLWAAFALGELGDGATTPALVGALTDPFPQVRKWSAYALSYTGGRSVFEPLVDRLGDFNVDVRIEVLSSLGRLGDPRAGDLMVRSLADPHPRVRRAAVDALGELGLASRAGDLLSCLQDQDRRVRGAVCWSLGKLDAIQALPDLLAAAEDPHWSVRRSAAWALGLLGDTAAVDTLEKLATSPVGVLRAKAVEALARTAPEATRPLLIGALRNDPHPSVREVVAWELRLRPDADSVAALMERVSDYDRDVRGSVAVALGGSGDGGVADRLRPGLSDPSLWVRGRVAAALGQLADHAAVKQLRQLVDHVDPWLAARATWALGRLGDRRPQPILRARLRTLASGDHRDVATVLAHFGDSHARRLTRSGLRHAVATRRRQWLYSVASALPDLVDRALLSRDGDGETPYFDPARAIDGRRVAMMARRLHRPEQEIRDRYRALAERIPLRLAEG